MITGKNTAFRSKFEKFKKRSDELYWNFKAMKSRLKSLSKEASSLLHTTNCGDSFDGENFKLLLQYSTHIDCAAEDIHRMLFNMKNSTFKKALAEDKRKKSTLAYRLD